MSLKTLSIIELVVHAVCIALCAVASGLSAHSIYITEFLFDDVLDFTPLVLALSSVTILFLSSSLLFTIFRRQPFLSKISVELVWSGFLWSVWFGTAGYVTWANTCPKIIGKHRTVCETHPVLTFVSFLVASLLLWHWITLLVVGHKLNEAGQRTWSMSLKELALRGSITGSRNLPTESNHEEPKFEYEQPSPTMFLLPPPAYAGYTVSLNPISTPSQGASTEGSPSLSHSHSSPEYDVSYPATVQGHDGWHASQQQHSRLPDGYEIPSALPSSHEEERPMDPETHPETHPTSSSEDTLSGESTNQSTPADRYGYHDDSRI
ncbi:hypothetical protein L218DRAFT_995018 [Marasmius fiardii PR-910]|nr:hypothetical protein L218DRAFT_995018 [Marasmius fiardii PR-910]